MKIRSVILTSALALVCGALLSSSAGATTNMEIPTTKMDIPEWVEVPAGATVRVLSDEPGREIYIVEERTRDEELAAARHLQVGQKMQVASSGETTSYQKLAATCTQSQSMTNPLSYVSVNSSGTWYIPGEFSFTRGSGCSTSYTWRASFWGNDTGVLGGQFGEVLTTTTSPGNTTTVFMNQICKTHDKQYQWRTDLRTNGGTVLIATPWAGRSCHR